MKVHQHHFAAAIDAKNRQFPLLLLAVILPLLTLPFADLHGNPWQRFSFPLAINLLILQSLRAMPTWELRWLGLSVDSLYRSFGLFGAVTVWIPFELGHQLPPVLRLGISLIRSTFFVLTVIRIIQVLGGCTRVSSRTLSLGAAGYIHMGLTGGQLATSLQLLDSDSFRLGTMAVGEELLARLSYFSFVTIGTLGYGDVVPASPIGESFVVLLSIASTLYVSLLIGLLLSRYLHSRTRVHQP